ncbi:hypothetical protein [Brevibacillus sp. SYSU BS000544]
MKHVSKEYLMQGVLVVLVLLLTFGITIVYAKKASKKKRNDS